MVTSARELVEFPARLYKNININIVLENEVTYIYIHNVSFPTCQKVIYFLNSFFPFSSSNPNICRCSSAQIQKFAKFKNFCKKLQTESLRGQSSSRLPAAAGDTTAHAHNSARISLVSTVQYIHIPHN